MKDQFLMIRDGDGKDRRKLISQLCNYYEEAGKRDVDHLPKVRPQNVLVLKYYSFENYFFNPKIMAQLGVVESENAFYQTFYENGRNIYRDFKRTKAYKCNRSRSDRTRGCKST